MPFCQKRARELSDAGTESDVVQDDSTRSADTGFIAGLRLGVTPFDRPSRLVRSPRARSTRLMVHAFAIDLKTNGANCSGIRSNHSRA
jgi:hypothetical protein